MLIYITAGTNFTMTHGAEQAKKGKGSKKKKLLS